jgi:CBS domain-containing protein
MTEAPATLPSTASITDAARLMRDSNIGNVVVTEGGAPCGILTDRDIVVRSVAERRPDATLGQICSRELVSASPDDDLGRAVELMRKHALRRLVVMADGKLAGVVSLGDLAMARDSKSALSEISAAGANR